MHINGLDLNLLRLFSAIYRSQSVSRAAEQLNLTQPVASQGLARLRVALGDALFVRTGGGVRPTPMAERLAPSIDAALNLLEQALSEGRDFDPRHSSQLLRLHMSDIGECRFLPPLMAYLHQHAPHLRVETRYVPLDDLPTALDSGNIHFAFGFLPALKGMASLKLVQDRYGIVMRSNHPCATLTVRPEHTREDLAAFQFVAVRTHADTTRLLQRLHLDSQLRLTVEHFTSLPAIMRATDLAAVVPYALVNMGNIFPPQEFTFIEPHFPMDDFTVSVHWSQRFQNEPVNRWFREHLIQAMFG